MAPAKLLYDPKQSRYTFLRARAEQAAPSITPQVAPAFGISALVSSAGGDLSILTPDFRPIMLSIPAGSLNNPVEVRMSLVTNLVGLPFAKGTFGTVQIEPESLVLLGAAQLSIEYPPDLDWRSVVSFAASNDGTGWGVTADRALSNRVVIPVSDFGLYGSASTTLEELQAVLGPAAPVSQLSVHALEAPTDTKHDRYCLKEQKPEQLAGCRQFHPDLLNVNTSQFPPSSRECFPLMVDRAVAVQRELREFLTCGIMADVGQAVAVERQKSLLGDTNVVDLSEALSCICPIYQQKIEPLWEEAKANCPLSIVLLQFMLGFEQQVQMLELTDVVNCNYTLSGNLDKVCKSAEGCLQQVKGCCDLGKKGREKYLEILQIVNRFELIGDTKCFPTQMDDPRVQEVVDVCLTNAWYGNIQIKRSGSGATNITRGSDDYTYSTAINRQFGGQVFSTDEFKTIAGPSVTMRISGTGTTREESLFTDTQTSTCFTTNTSIYNYRSDRLTTGSLTLNGEEFPPKVFLLHLNISDDNKIYSLSGGPPELTGRQRDRSLTSRTDCDGKTRITPDSNEADARITIPGFSVKNRTMGTDTNILEGTQSVVEVWEGTPVLQLTTEVTWNLRRALQR